MNRTIFLRWVVANILSAVVGFLTGLLLGLVIGPFEMLRAGTTGAVVGFAQWQVLRDYLKDMRSLPWVVVTGMSYGLSVLVVAIVSLGFAMAGAVGMELNKDAVTGFIQLSRETNPYEAVLAMANTFGSARFAAALVGATGGLVVGVAQWWVLRHYVRGSLLWVPIVAVGGLVGLSASLFTSLYTYDGLDNNASLFVVVLSLSPAGIFMFGSVVTGLGLMWLLRASNMKSVV